MIFPMASTIVAPKVDLVEIILKAIQIPEQTEGLEAALKSIGDRITPEQHEALWDGAMTMLCYAQDTAFRLGWEMRSQV